MPPVPPNLVRAHFNFSLGSEELAVTTLTLQLAHGAGNQLDWPTATTLCAEKLRDKWKTRMDPVAGMFPNEVRLRDVVTYHLDAATGHAMDRGQAVSASNDQWKGSGGPSLPFEVALVVSLQAFGQGAFVTNRGRHRGRMYLPPLAITAMAGAVDTQRQGRLSSGFQNELTTALQNLFNDIQHMNATDSGNALGGDDFWNVGILSRKDVEFRTIESIRLGDVFDAQTRRRNGQREVYTAAAIGSG